MAEQPPGLLSQRAARALTPALSYGKAFADAQSRPWSPQDTEGNIICSVAENKLTADMLHERMSRATPSVAPVSTLYYPKGFKGTEEARKAMARMMSRTFMQGIEVDPNHLALLAGAGAILDTLFWCICGQGEGVLLPTPIYPAFINDMEVRSACAPVLFELVEPGQEACLAFSSSSTASAATAAGAAGGSSRGSVSEQLDAAAAGAAAEGKPVKVLLIAQPNNPLGTVYQPETIVEMLRWCLRNKVHFVSDEIYANSVWGEGAPAFESTEVLARREVETGGLPKEQAGLVPQLVHVVFGLSKDFCASGLRVGGLHTRNSTLMQAIDNLCYFHTPSTPVMHTLTEVLADDAFLDAFVAENKRRLRAAYTLLADALDAAGIPHVRACAAMFAWVDLRAGLLEDSWEGEEELWRALCTDARVLFTPGKACAAHAPGFFRICWAWVAPEALPMAVARVKALLEERSARKAN